MSRINNNLQAVKAFVFDVDGVLSPSTIPMLHDGTPSRMVNIKDGYALQLACKHNYKIAIITGADTEAVRHRYTKLGIKDVYLKAAMKLPLLKQWIEENSLTPDEVIYCGDDIPDYECMDYVGIAVTPADAADEIKNIVD